MNYDIIKEGQVIDLEEGEGIVCFKKVINGDLYLNIAFEEEQTHFQIYQVAIQNDSVFFKKVTDPKLFRIPAVEIFFLFVGELVYLHIPEADLSLGDLTVNTLGNIAFNLKCLLIFTVKKRES